jgi:peptidoglycan/xylan/chitin deacetylase (PgdA/CDA1 family)
MKRKFLAILFVLLLGLLIFAQPAVKMGSGRATADSPSFPRALVSVVMDDGWKSQAAAALPRLNTKGIKATAFIVTKYIEEGYEGYMTLADLQALKTSGHEIASHSVTHRDLTVLTPEELTAELRDSKAWLEEKGLGPVYDFACPFGEYNDATIKETKHFYLSQREAWSWPDDMNTAANFRPYMIHVKQVLPTTTAAEVTGWMNEAMNNKAWVVLIYHRVEVLDPSHPSYLYSISPDDFEAHLQAIRDSGVASLTVKEALDEVKTCVKYAVTAAVSGDGGSVSPSSQTVDCLGDATVSLSPEAGNGVASIVDNGEAVPGPYGSTYNMPRVGEDHEVLVTFQPVGQILQVTKVSPNQAWQFAFTADLTVEGTGFIDGASVKLEKNGVSIPGLGVSVNSSTRITCSVWTFGAEPGEYDVVVSNPSGAQASLAKGFRINPVCGMGSGSALLMMGITLGLLSLTGSLRLRRKRGR